MSLSYKLRMWVDVSIILRLADLVESSLCVIHLLPKSVASIMIVKLVRDTGIKYKAAWLRAITFDHKGTGERWDVFPLPYALQVSLPGRHFQRLIPSMNASNNTDPDNLDLPRFGQWQRPWLSLLLSKSCVGEVANASFCSQLTLSHYFCNRLPQISLFFSAVDVTWPRSLEANCFCTLLWATGLAQLCCNLWERPLDQ
jgi:hypothetical protein